MADQKWLTRALDQARRDLIDLTRRNRLLHAPLEGKRPWCMAITGHDPNELFEKLYRQENFRGFAFKPRRDDSDDHPSLTIRPPAQVNSSQETGSSRRPRLQTRLDHDNLQKRLAKIFREERTLEEEQGLSTLYLALGFLKWFDSDQAEEASFAPLLLLPVTMVRVGGSDGYLLRGRDDDIVSNISLREKLKSNFDINLPDIPEDEEWKPSNYHDLVAREIRRQVRWHDREAVGLGFFTFSKFLMWRDLHPDSWPNNALLDHPLVNILLGQGSEFEFFSTTRA